MCTKPPSLTGSAAAATAAAAMLAALGQLSWVGRSVKEDSGDRRTGVGPVESTAQQHTHGTTCGQGEAPAWNKHGWLRHAKAQHIQLRQLTQHPALPWLVATAWLFVQGKQGRQ